ncbi:hypothetical protein [Caenimonas soli]|uniref:hypothetical protein n=1 Tax=Caenimonas soli TaxID=2735555 RepID=UPI0015554C59|nr:hypothetical protein [Caenimonas soli]NPC57190.1 hypothetical protein [Caenimonas soli]
MNIAIASIVTPEFLGHALAAWRRADFSGGAFKVVVFGVGFGAEPDLAPESVGSIQFEFRHVEQRLTSQELQLLVQRYTPAEVCFALKPIVMQWLLDETFDYVHYLDADIHFYAPVRLLQDAVEQPGDIFLSPHCLFSLPLDDRRPTALTLLRSGSFNGGYVVVKRTGEGVRFLRWWRELVMVHGQNDPRNGTCGDQRWLDWAPAMFPTLKVLRHPGINVGYWNLHEREITRCKGQYFANGERLIFFHASGFTPERATAVSCYQDRIAPPLDSPLSDLLHDLAQLFHSAEDDHVNSGRYAYRRWWHGSSKVVRAYRRHLCSSLLDHARRVAAGSSPPPEIGTSHAN